MSRSSNYSWTRLKSPAVPEQMVCKGLNVLQFSSSPGQYHWCQITRKITGGLNFFFVLDFTGLGWTVWDPRLGLRRLEWSHELSQSRIMIFHYQHRIPLNYQNLFTSKLTSNCPFLCQSTTHLGKITIYTIQSNMYNCSLNDFKVKVEMMKN